MGMEDGALSLIENNSKRMMKSPLQIESLEDFYQEHKYPSESMKLEFANEIGLSLKQVSGWFCHRRAKDKGMVATDEGHNNGFKHNVSDAVHEYSTGVIQESCSSTKHDDFRHFEVREVESKRLNTQNFAKQILPSEKRRHRLHSRHHQRRASSIDDLTPQSSLESQEMLLPVIEEPCGGAEIWRNMHDEDVKRPSATHLKDLKHTEKNTRGGHLSMKELRSFCVSSVKRKLGRFYDEDGPPLSIDFDPLPPGSFDSAIVDTVNEAYHVRDCNYTVKSHSMARVSKYPEIFDEYSCEPQLRGSFSEPKGYRRKMQGLTRKQELNNYPSNSKLILTDKRNERQIQTSDIEIGNGFTTEDFGFENNLKETCKKPDLHPPLYNDHRAQMLQRRKLKQRTDSLDDEDDVKHRLRVKDIPLVKQHKTNGSLGQKRLCEKKTRISERPRDEEFWRKNYVLAMPCSSGSP